MDDLLKHITSTQNEFNPKILEHDAINSDNDYINIYNNQKDQVYHKFWFLLEDLRYINIYYNKNYNNVRFAFNNRTDKNMKFTKYLKDIAEHVLSIFKKHYTSNEVIIHYPWKEQEHEYPYTILFLTNMTSIICDSNNQPMTNGAFDTETNYSMIFEIANIAITKDICNNAMVYNLKFRPFIKIVKKEPAVNFLSFTKPMHKMVDIPQKQHIPTIAQQTIEPSFSQQPLVKQNTPAVIRPQICLDPKTLLNMKQALRKTTTADATLPEDNGTKQDFLDVKSNLKNVIVEEKSLIPHLINEHKNKIKEQELQKQIAEVIPQPVTVIKKKKVKKTN